MYGFRRIRLIVFFLFFSKHVRLFVYTITLYQDGAILRRQNQQTGIASWTSPPKQSWVSPIIIHFFITMEDKITMRLSPESSYLPSLPGSYSLSALSYNSILSFSISSFTLAFKHAQITPTIKLLSKICKKIKHTALLSSTYSQLLLYFQLQLI